ncbi:hypothetical protein KIN20_024844 [Parelaphostrongylus tenuis]|uniref:C4H2-type domain-containing protein n=1 Tax=Parelaphostrongylus tenuis TaxID=148309 RepID=A0AAD5MU40_PARTN|nr:hypothetical protein KIN20_024844 [Parelaphostrongylus tenuis]
MNMDLENLTEQLNGLVVVGDRLRSFQACYSDVCTEENLLSEVKNHLENCRKTEEDLENERKGHAEELRQINQDINQLEDILKTLRSERETKRARLTRQMDELRVAMNQANESIRAAEISTVTLEDLSDIPKELLEGIFVPSSTRNPPTSFSFLNSHFPFLSPLTMTSSVKGLMQDMNKMKTCESCGAQIHRNAPTCPMCKMRSRSKKSEEIKKERRMKTSQLL